MTSTQQNETLQAVRLLYKYAVKGSEGHEPEALYQARVLLEGFIKSAGVLESTEDAPSVLINDDDGARAIIYGGVIFTVGQRVYINHGNYGTVENVKPAAGSGVLVRNEDNVSLIINFKTLTALNPTGSFK